MIITEIFLVSFSLKIKRRKDAYQAKKKDFFQLNRFPSLYVKLLPSFCNCLIP